MSGQHDILQLLAGPRASITECNLILDMNDPAQFERGYQIAMSLESRYQNDSYYRPTYHSIRVAYARKSPALMHAALTRICIDLVNR